MKVFFLLGCISAFLSVALGAFGAHGLEGRISAKMLEVWKTGVTYQMFHSGGLFVVAFLLNKLPNMSLINTAGWFMTAGIIIFSGSLYALSTSGIKILGAITPIGGVAFLTAWVMLGIAAVKGL
ncbi:DUF423 domain-containing protein [Ectobacillus ponti]|uniref:DUF423 domain-containing protein n=1 Tax=Ectobacillus ponti TaxID=2961894 RepID=A0AA41X3J7_9BACI|nr:DUF423 domain-containing protein [Ectobacillus ponti]MCP8968012.1 DUF423 domain-containing protein [Ectobacillus ponti]